MPPVILEHASLAGDEFVDSLHLRAPNRSLNVRHLVLEANDLGPELARFAARPAVIAKRQNLLEEIAVIRDEHAAFARCDGFAAVKRERPEESHRTCAATMPNGTERFSGVFDHRKAMPRAYREQGIHVAKIAV